MTSKAWSIRIALGLAIIAGSFVGWQSIIKVKLRVIGQPTTTGVIQQQIEEPFFKGLASAAGLPVNVVYTPMDKAIARDHSQLAALKGGFYEIASLRLLQNVRSEPSLSGIDLPGAAANFPAARRFATRFSTQIGLELERNWNSRLLGVWSFGPQVLMCNAPIARLGDMKGRRVRVPSDSLGFLVSYFGGTAMEISFVDTMHALEKGMVDCTISSLASASAAGWLQKTKHVLNIMLQGGINAYVISNEAWSKLSPEQQIRLSAAITDLEDRIWIRAESIHKEMASCTQDRNICSNGELTVLDADEADLQLLAGYAQSVGLRAWQDDLGPSCQDCLVAWQEAKAASKQDAGTAAPNIPAKR